MKKGEVREEGGVACAEAVGAPDVRNVTILDEDSVRRAKNNVRARKTRIILCAVLIPVVAFTLFFAIVLNVRSLGVGEGSLDGAYTTVLADIEGLRDANPRVIDIAMLGAHDANTSSIKNDAPLDDSAEGILKDLIPVSRGFQYRYAVTQAVSVENLLKQGVRFLHLKYTYFEGNWLVSHSFAGGEIRTDIMQILGFLAQNPGELLVLLFQPTYFGDQSYDTFHNWLAGVTLNGKNIYDYVYYDKANVFGYVDNGGTFAEGECALNNSRTGTHISALRYNTVTDDGNSAGVVLLDRREKKIDYNHDTPTSEYSDLFYDMDFNAEHEWHNRLGEKALTECIGNTADEIAAGGEHRTKLRVNQTQAAFSTETFGDVMRALGAWSLLKFAEKHNAALVENEDFYEWLRAMPVFQVDFANSSYGDFNAKVNALIRSYNEQIVALLVEEGATYADIYR